MRGAIPSLPQYAFMAWCLVKHRDFTFYLYFFVRLDSKHGKDEKCMQYFGWKSEGKRPLGRP
jgi:hypothetical protein